MIPDRHAKGLWWPGWGIHVQGALDTNGHAVAVTADLGLTVVTLIELDEQSL